MRTWEEVTYADVNSKVQKLSWSRLNTQTLKSSRFPPLNLNKVLISLHPVLYHLNTGFKKKIYLASETFTPDKQLNDSKKSSLHLKSLRLELMTKRRCVQIFELYGGG